MKQCLLFTVLFSAAIMSPFIYADTLTNKSSTTPYPYYSALLTMSQTEIEQQRSKLTKTSPPIKENDNLKNGREKSSVLPFLGDEARAMGHKLPLPFGISINHMNIRQNLKIDSMGFSRLCLGTFPIPSDMFDILVRKSREKSKTETFKLDVWLLPFMNVYGIVGYTKGSSVSNIDVSAAGGLISVPNLDFSMDYKGFNYGAGTTLVSGFDKWFTSLDINYTRTHFNILEGSIDTLTLSPRVGYGFTLPAINVLHIAPTALDIWIGGVYQKVQEHLKGKIKDLNIPQALQTMLSEVNQNGDGRFDVTQHQQSPWNILAGARYEVTQNFNITTEFGLSKRDSFFISGEYRF